MRERQGHVVSAEAAHSGMVASSTVFRGPTWQVEECVQDIKALCIVSLDELVRVPFTDLGAGKKEETRLNLSFLLSGAHTYAMSEIN